MARLFGTDGVRGEANVSLMPELTPFPLFPCLRASMLSGFPGSWTGPSRWISTSKGSSSTATP